MSDQIPEEAIKAPGAELSAPDGCPVCGKTDADGEVVIVHAACLEPGDGAPAAPGFAAAHRHLRAAMDALGVGPAPDLADSRRAAERVVAIMPGVPPSSALASVKALRAMGWKTPGEVDRSAKAERECILAALADSKVTFTRPGFGRDLSEALEEMVRWSDVERVLRGAP